MENLKQSVDASKEIIEKKKKKKKKKKYKNLK